MDSKCSKYLTAKPDDFFGGASQITSTTLSDLGMAYEALAAMIPTGTTAFAFHDRIPGAHFGHVMKLETDEKTDAAQMKVIWQKFCCHALISRLPEAALHEVQDRLLEIFEDYVSRKTTPTLPEAFGPRVFMAHQGRHYSRPEIELED
jgi:hypothetical protein